MKTLAASLALLWLAGSAAAPVAAQPANASSAKPPAKSPANPAPRPAAKAAPKAAPAPPLAEALPEQLRAAEIAHLGTYDCEFDQKLQVQLHPKTAGYVDVSHLKNTWTMKPVLSSTGVLRLEDVKGKMLMLQAANKSMVMDVQLGRRLLDGCQHEVQKAWVRPADAEGLGIAPAPAPAPAASAPK